MVNTCSPFLDARACSCGDVFLGNCANHVFCHYYLSSRHVTLNAFHHLIFFSFLFIFFKTVLFPLIFFTLHSVSFSFYLPCTHFINPSCSLQLHHESFIRLWKPRK